MVVTFEGRLDTQAAESIEQDLQPVYEYKDCDIKLDCSKLEYISSKGLRLFLKICQKAKENQCHTYLSGMNDTVRDVFVVTGFVNFFELK